MRNVSGDSRRHSPGCSNPWRCTMNPTIVKLDRRSFLKSSAVVAGGLILGFHLPGENDAAAQSPTPSAKLNAWIQIAPDDTVTMTIHKPEFGQGTVTSLSMLLAED